MTQVPSRPWYAFLTPLIGKIVRFAARLTRHGGSALPGGVIERIDPTFLARTLENLPLGVVLVSGTNGKTTTTRMVASMLTALGLKVFTNPTGSNFTRGVASALLGEVDLAGRLDADIAVLELDEAYAVHFVRQVKPRYSLLLNVMRDQLDRFGEIDNTARLLSHVAEATTATVVLNREDPRIAALSSCTRHSASVRYYGLTPALRKFFPSDDDMHGQDSSGQVTAEDLFAIDQMPSGSGAGVETSTGAPDGVDADVRGAESEAAGADPDAQDDNAPEMLEAGEASAIIAALGKRDSNFPCRSSHHNPDALRADVTLTQVGDHTASFNIGGVPCSTEVRLAGVYNLFNAAGALAVVRAIVDRSPDAVLADVNVDKLMDVLSDVTPAFGRGEVIDYHGEPVELVLVKNPMGFRLSLSSFDPSGTDTMIAICDEYADGRDMSWLWDVDFTSLRESGVAMVSGKRAWDMALRLGYDQVPVGETDVSLSNALETFLAINPGKPKRVYCTYTSMLKVRAKLSHMTDVADAGVGR